MCMLTYIPPQIQPDTKRLMNGAEIHTDGYGYAIVIPGDKPRLFVQHGLDAEVIIKDFAEMRSLFPDGPALFHSRWGTSGIKGLYNCHPFQIGGDSRTVVAHNGVLPNTMQPNQTDIRCDTRMAAEDIFGSAYGHLNAPMPRQNLAQAIGKGNKLVILTIDPHFKDSAYIINEEQGVWDEGIWYSNHDYLPGRGYSGYNHAWDSDWNWEDYGWRWTGKEWEATSSDTIGTPPKVGNCPECKAIGSVDLEYSYCEMCNTCLDCMEDLRDCVCYLPADSNLVVLGKDDE